MNNERLNQAAYELSDEIYKVKDKLDKANLIVTEMLGEYFEKFDAQDKDGQTSIIWEFSRNKTFAHIIDDYIYGAKDIINELKARIEKTVDEKNNKIIA